MTSSGGSVAVARQPELIPDLEYDSDDDMWPSDVKQCYLDQVFQSDGFEVDSFPRTEVSVIKPMDIYEKYSHINFLKAAAKAIQNYNHIYEDRKGGQLEFVKVVKCMWQCMPDGDDYYFLTFDARDLSKDEVRTYQAVLFQNWEVKLEVQSFRLKPFDGEEQGNREKSWYWRRHVFDGFPHHRREIYV